MQGVLDRKTLAGRNSGFQASSSSAPSGEMSEHGREPLAVPMGDCRFPHQERLAADAGGQARENADST